jgi:hypothetical protein
VEVQHAGGWGDVACCSANRLLPGPASLATGRWEAPGTTHLQPNGRAGTARAKPVTASLKAVEDQERGYGELT